MKWWVFGWMVRVPRYHAPILWVDNDDILDEYVMDETNHMNDHEIFKDDEAHLQNM